MHPTCVSSLNVAGNTKLNTVTTCISSFNVSGITIISNNVVIGGSAANNILQVINAGRLKIGSGATDYSLIGTSYTDYNTTNTKIFILVIHVLLLMQLVVYSILQQLQLVHMYFMLDHH
jgi:hypothetical protein